jgi:rhodanese-related sulfurtransferase
MKTQKFIMFFLTSIIILMTFSLTSFAKCQPDELFPLRLSYPGINCVSSNEVAQHIKNNSAIIIDSRSSIEYKVLHVNNAINIHYSSKVQTFIDEVKAIRTFNPLKKIIFYCNGHNCSKSYMATNSSISAGINNVFAYDAGILEFSAKFPNLVALLDNKITNKNSMISQKEFKSHLKHYPFFSQKLITSRNSKNKFYLLDIRTGEQRLGVSAFMGGFREKRITLNNNEKLLKFLQKVKKSQAPLFAYDYVGKQVRWLQYYIKQLGIKEYYLLEGGSQKQHLEYLTNNILTIY